MVLSVVIPAYNEAENLIAVVTGLKKALLALVQPFEIIIVNDGSTDSTSTILAELSKTVHELVVITASPKGGYSAAILLGLAASRGSVLTWMHADNQVHPDYLVQIFKKLINEKKDICKGVRVVRDESLMRRVQSFFYNKFFQILFHNQLRDINGTPKVFRREIFDACKLQSKDWFIDLEFMIAATTCRAKIGEVDVMWEKRTGGKSKVTWNTALKFFVHMLRLRFFKLG